MLILLQADGEVAALMVMLSLAEAVCGDCDESVTVNETAEVPTELEAGVPVMDPVEPPIARPPGSAFALNAYGAVPPLADIEAVYAAPAVPAGREVVVMLSGVG